LFDFIISPGNTISEHDAAVAHPPPLQLKQAIISLSIYKESMSAIDISYYSSMFGIFT
jgi:hypothetical protein